MKHDTFTSKEILKSQLELIIHFQNMINSVDSLDAFKILLEKEKQSCLDAMFPQKTPNYEKIKNEYFAKIGKELPEKLK